MPRVPRSSRTRVDNEPEEPRETTRWRSVRLTHLSDWLATTVPLATVPLVGVPLVAVPLVVVPLIVVPLIVVLSLQVAAAQPGPVPASPALNPASAYVCEPELRAALNARSQAAEARAADVARRAEELLLAELGLAASVSLGGGLEVGENLARPGTGPTWEPELELDASLGYRYDEVALARARQALDLADGRHSAQLRADVLEALVTFSRLRVAQRTAAQAENAAAEAEELAASVRTSAALAAPDAPDVLLDVRELELAARRARANADGRSAEVEAARAHLAALGAEAGPLDGALPNGCVATDLMSDGAFDSGIRPPTLPPPDPTASHERLLLLRSLELAAAQHRRAAFGPLADLSLTGRYQGAGSRITAELALDGGRPAAEVSVRYRDVATHDWSIGLSATFELDPTMGPELEAAAQRHDAARNALDAYDAGFDERVRTEIAAVHDAWMEVEFALEAHAIAVARLELATTAPETTRDRETTRARDIEGRTRDALEREYQAYLRAVNTYLNAFDLPWSALLERP